MTTPITTEELRKLVDDMRAMPGYLSEATTAGDLSSRREEALRLFSRHALPVAAELITARAKLEAAEKLAAAARPLAEGFRAMLEAGDVIRNLSAVGRASLTGEVLTAEAALAAWEAAK